MTSEVVLDIRCKCGGRLKKSVGEVEFFGIDFGIRPVNICTKCGSEYLSQEIMEEVEIEIKKRGFFGLESRGPLQSPETLWSFAFPRRS